MQKQKMLLKDFLREDSRPHSANIEATTLLRSRSRRISALETMINAFKNIPFGSSVNKPYSIIFPRSLSRKLSAQRLPKKSRKGDGHDHGHGGDGEQAKMTVRIKDIIRWRSFRDLAEEPSWPSDFHTSPPIQCSSAATVTTTGSSSSTESNSNGSSWCESDFTLEFSPPWNGNFQEYSKPCVGKYTVEALPGPTTGSFCDIEPKRVSFYEEKEQHSPVSVIDAEFGEDEGFCWSRDQSQGNISTGDAQFLLRQPWQFESVACVQSSTSMGDIDERSDEEEDDEFREEQGDSNEATAKKATMLLNQVNASRSGLSLKTNADKLLLDYFISELSTLGCSTTNDDSELVMVNTAKSWMNNELGSKCEWGINSKKDAYLREMDRGEKWRKFEEEKEEIASVVEAKIMGNLVDELLSDFILN
ncbi:hypothetical protein BT93_E0198 [Corymbia citriodora subsp. variegata]|nr:hypothetical protein BT93_E0198 [Corymbia citriodora subsp. variegata]